MLLRSPLLFLIPAMFGGWSNQKPLPAPPHHPPRPTVTVSFVSGPTSITTAGTYGWEACTSGSDENYDLFLWENYSNTLLSYTTTDNGIDGCVFGTINVTAGTYPLQIEAQLVYPPSSTIAAEAFRGVSVNIPTPFTVYIVGGSYATGDYPVTFNSSVAGGTSPYTYSWAGDNGLSGTGASVTTTYPDLGYDYTAFVHLDAYDSAGHHSAVGQYVTVCTGGVRSC